jgi:glycerophosphoryl diester phosphodiesterase
MRRTRLPAFGLLGALLALACGRVSGDVPPGAEHRYFVELAAPRPWVIAHRGGMGLWPENTLRAFAGASALGADVLDLDVRTSADGALVVFHDAELGRTTEASGPLAALPLRELQALDAGYRWSADGGATHPFRGQGLRIPTLEEVFRAFPDAHLGLEIKETDPAAPARVCRAIREARRQARPLPPPAPCSKVPLRLPFSPAVAR